MYVRLIEELQWVSGTFIEIIDNQEGADLIRSLQVSLPAMGHQRRPTPCTPLFINAGMQSYTTAFGSLKVMNELEQLGFKLVSTDCISVRGSEHGDTRKYHYCLVYMQRADIK